MKKYCHCRFDDGVYLITCMKPKGHDGPHVEASTIWTDEQGWWDIYGDSPERARHKPKQEE